MELDQQRVNVIKLNPQGEETWRYEGLILAKNNSSILIEAYFNREDFLFHDIWLKENDRFIERYFNDRWYNIFEIHDRDDDRLKGWYCNITKPAKFSWDEIRYIDLALDLLVYPGGNYLILDEDEFDRLSIDDKTRREAIKALDALVSIVETGHLSEMLKLD